MRTGAILSGLLHLGLIVVAMLGLPRWIKPEPLDQQVIPIEFIAEVAQQRSAPPEPPKPPIEVAKAEPPPPPPEPEPEPVKAPEPPPPPKALAKAEPEPPPPPKPEKAPEPPPKPAPPKAATPAPRPAPAPKAKPKPPPKPKPKVAEKEPEPPKPDDFLSRMHKAVSKHKPPPEPEPPPPQPQLARADVPVPRLGDFAKRLTMSEEDAVRRHIMQCWNPPVGARDASDMEVRIIGNLRRDGLVQRVDVVERDKARMRQDQFFRTFAESALRAFYKCRQLPLPPDKYESWKTFDIGFNLKDMLSQ